ncbi:MAG: DEAD/DEAH box helicase [Chloroflexota bacterium]|nr:DEAD/DEAH box helicase [Chloroflexota bacterium]
MQSVLHGTWVTTLEDESDGSFFVWAERPARGDEPKASGNRVQRHFYAATAIEIADLLSLYAPGTDWHNVRRVTRIALLPSYETSPVVPRWLSERDHDAEEVALKPWRIEGLDLPILDILDVLVALPLKGPQVTANRLGDDLRYWGFAAKFTLELLARERFVPGLHSHNGIMRAMWVPMLEDAENHQRLLNLAMAMPPACRAIFRERPKMTFDHVARQETLLQTFMEQLVDNFVRKWGLTSAENYTRQSPLQRDNASNPTQAWWQALWSENREVDLPTPQRRSLAGLYQEWQNWSYGEQQQEEASFRVCFRLTPPEFDTDRNRILSPDWELRYFLQAVDDPSLLIPARKVWQERGNVLSYLNRHFNHPQETLLEGLGIAARLCPAIRRSLKEESPEGTTLTDREAYSFLRETVPLLERAGFGVHVPPWWNKPDTRLQVRLKFHGDPPSSSMGVLDMRSLVAYDWELALGDEKLLEEEFERLVALKTPLVQVRGRWVLLQPDQVEAAIAFWEKQRETDQTSLDEALKIALGTKNEMDGLPVQEVESDGWLSELMGLLKQEEKVEELPPPEGFVGTLRPYQIRGLSWIYFLRQWGLGACLADDMGLGKTIQTIALLLHERQEDPDMPPSLVICPTSLVGNWQREVSRFAPSLRVVVHHGSSRPEGDEFVKESAEHDLVISTYGLARRDIDDLQRVHWSDVILDEAQNIKNPHTKQARAIRRIPSDYRLALTGTPIENRLTELWSIMSFLNPGYLGSLESFRRTFAIPIERYGDEEASEQLRRLVRPFILRRLKTDPKVIQDLPEKFEYKVYCNLTREQATLYEAVVRDTMNTLEEDKENGMRRRGLILAMLTRLKQICDHPTLFLGDRSRISSRSGKLNRLCEMLEEILEVRDRALVFTQFAQMGKLLQRHLQNRFGQEVLFLHGGTPQKRRQRMLTRFQEDSNAPPIFVLSLKAGGTGLNLMRANHVFHYDRWWNPAVENQATDRAYRIGQKQDVQVHKFICLGTLEERIDQLIESKRALAENIVGQGEGWVTELDTEELRDLISLRAEAIEVE